MLPVKRTLLPTVSRFLDDNWTNLFDWSERDYLGMNMTLPAVNIKETGDAFYVEMAAPGMKKEDFDIELENNILTIKSEMKSEDELREENSTLEESSVINPSRERLTSIKRSLMMPRSTRGIATGSYRLYFPRKKRQKINQPEE